MVKKYNVKPGDTVSKILEKNDLMDTEFESHNDLNELIFIKDQIVLIPQPSDTSVKLIAYKTEDLDTLAKMCKKFNVSCEHIRYFNRIDNLYLTDDQVIQLGEEKVSQD